MISNWFSNKINFWNQQRFVKISRMMTILRGQKYEAELLRRACVLWKSASFSKCFARPPRMYFCSNFRSKLKLISELKSLLTFAGKLTYTYSLDGAGSVKTCPQEYWLTVNFAIKNNKKNGRIYFWRWFVVLEILFIWELIKICKGVKTRI